MSNPAEKRATYADVLTAPPHVVAEVIAGVLYTQPRPRVRHARAASALGARLHDFGSGEGERSAWILLDETELHLGVEPDIMVPDLAGWRRERMPSLPLDDAYLTVVPDWICEILSPSTEATDRADKMPIYAREGVACAWLLDPDAKLLEVFELERGRWTVAQVFRGEGAVRAKPFEALEIVLGSLWAP